MALRAGPQGRRQRARPLAGAPDLPPLDELRIPPDRRRLWSALLVAGIAWSAHFLFFQSFGLYEDDFLVVAPQLTWTWRDALGSVQHILRSLQQGRPIGFAIASLVPFTCFQLGGVRALPLVYLAASGIIVLNALLVHRLLSIAYGPSFALLGALAFTLYPADTSQPFLTHALVLQPSLTLVLLALLAYLRQRRVLAYALAAGAFLTYESGVLAFFAAPLLRATWGPGTVRRWALHVALLLAIVAAVLALRVVVGEYRAANLEHSDQGGVTWSQAPARVLEAVWTGPRVSLAAFVKRPAWAVEDLANAWVALGVVAAFLAMFAVFALGHGFAAGMADRPVLLRAGITGLVMLVGGYALEFSGWHFPPIHEAGRMSAVHLGATLGAAILVASLLALPWRVAPGRPARLALGAGAALYLALLFGFRIMVQRGFVRSAEQQRQYWSRIVALVPDLSADSVVLLIGSEPPQNPFILPSSWADTWVFRFLFHDARGRSPYLVGGHSALYGNPGMSGFDESLLQARDGRLEWSGAAPGWLRIDRWKPLESGKLVVLQRRRFRWRRLAGSITLRGIDVDLPPPPPGATIRLVPGPLHDLLIEPADRGSGSSTALQ